MGTGFGWSSVLSKHCRLLYGFTNVAAAGATCNYDSTNGGYVITGIPLIAAGT